MPTLITAMEDTAASDTVTVMARGLLMPRLTTEDSAMAHTAMERGPLMLRPSPRLLPTMDMAATALTAMARGPLMLRLTTEDSAMAHTAMERGPLMLTTEDSATDPMATASVPP